MASVVNKCPDCGADCYDMEDCDICDLDDLQVATGYNPATTGVTPVSPVDVRARQAPVT